MKRHRYAIGLGANLGAPLAGIGLALACLRREPECALQAVSSIYRSAPVGPPQPDYFNAAAALDSTLSPAALLTRLQAIEARFLRQRALRWGPRTLDLDILWCDRPVTDANLEVPHPRLTERWWALQPMLDVLPELAPRYSADAQRLGLPYAPPLVAPAVTRGPLAAASGRRYAVALSPTGLGPLDGLLCCVRALSEDVFGPAPDPAKTALATVTFADLHACAQGLVARVAGGERWLGGHVCDHGGGLRTLVLGQPGRGRPLLLSAFHADPVSLQLDVVDGA